MGGSGQINAMAYVRGNRRDYDTWELMGNPGWGWDSVLEYFKKSEDNTDERHAQDKRHHGTGGPMKVGRIGAKDKLKESLGEGLTELGLKEINVSNSDKFVGYYEVQGNIHGGERFGAAKAFLISAKGRTNLNIIKNAHVTKLKFDANGRVNGVQFKLDKSEMSVFATKEVVLSAGSIGSPQILMLSGIGPRAQLEKHNIIVQKNLPVGFNLQDHILIPFGMAFDKSTSIAFTLTDLADQMFQFNVYRKGKLTNYGGSDITVFASTVDDPKYPDMQYHAMTFERQHPGLRLMLELFNIKTEVVESFLKYNEQAKLIVWYAVLLTPKSRGRIELDGKSPFDAPKIYPNYLYEKEDLDVLVKGVKILSKLSTTKAFAKHEGELAHLNLTSCDTYEYQSDLYWECYVRHLTTTLYHPVGTCKMGPLSEEDTVVDPELKVKGVNGLRVVDASIMPKIVSGNTNAATIMIGEMGADLIKKDWPVSKHEEL